MVALLPAPCIMETKIVWNYGLEKRGALKNNDKASIKARDDDAGRHKKERMRNNLGDNDNLR